MESKMSNDRSSNKPAGQNQKPQHTVAESIDRRLIEASPRPENRSRELANTPKKDTTTAATGKRSSE